MTKKEFKSALLNIFAQVLTELNGTKLERVNNWNGEIIPAPIIYGAISERCMERQLKELSGRKRLTTFMSDLSVGEWFGLASFLDTIKNAMVSWKDDEKYMAEFVLCVNWKAWEHDARENYGWSALYSRLYDGIRDLMFEYYENEPDKSSYLWQYLD